MAQAYHNAVVLPIFRYPAARNYGKRQTKQRGKQNIASNT
jgi:hypothetical protein